MSMSKSAAACADWWSVRRASADASRALASVIAPYSAAGALRLYMCIRTFCTDSTFC